MRVRRHLPPLRLPAREDWQRGLARLRAVDPRLARRWAAIALGAVLAGYLTAALILFPAPIFSGTREVPRLLELDEAAAREQIAAAGLALGPDSSEAHASAEPGTVIWQDPPPGVRAPEETRVLIVTSRGAAKVPMPDVAGYDAQLARAFVRAAGLVVSRVESIPGSAAAGVVMATRPPAPAVVAPGTRVVLIVSQGAAIIGVPQLLGLSTTDARVRLEQDGLRIGTVERRRTYDATPGTVIAQRPAAGTLAAPGTVVDIVIARSP
jgi:serine/threonine-protein kinase